MLADLIPIKKKKAFKDRFAEYFGRCFWQIPKENLYHEEIYLQKIATAGFLNGKIESIWRNVYPPFVKFARIKLKTSAIKGKFNPMFRFLLSTSLQARQKLDPNAMDYVLVTAHK